MIDKIKFLLRGFANFLLTMFQRRYLITEMAKRDIATQHVGSMLGFLWTFINPLVMIAILWLVFPFPGTIPMHDMWLGLLCELFGMVEFVKEKTIRYGVISQTSASDPAVLCFR